MSIQTEDRRAAVTISASWNGVGTAPTGSQVEINAPGAAAVSVQLTSNSFSGTVQFEGLIDEANGAWFAVNAYPFAGGAAVTSATGTGAWVIPMAAACRIRVRCSAFTSGTLNTALRASSAPPAGSASGGGSGGSTSTPSYTRIEDGAGTNLATVSAFHNQDNTTTGTGFGLLTGGVAQLLNIAGNLDRQREAGIDSIPALGIATGAAQFAMAFATTDSTDNFNPGSRTFTPVAMSGNVMGVPWSIQVGGALTLDSGASAENVIVTAVTATTFTCVTAKAHNGTVTAFPIAGFVFNQERDVAGELDTKGAGAAVAVEYEYNSGAPGNINYDRGRNLNAKGLTTGTISSGGGVASTSITFSSAPTGLQPGSPLLLTGGTSEVVYTTASYAAGTNPVAIQSAIVNASHTGASWESYVATGPGLNGFLPFGVAIEEEALFDPVSGNFFLERAATQDAVSGQNVVMESAALWNGATLDREIEAPAATTAVNRTGIGYDAIALFNSSNQYQPLLSMTAADGTAAPAYGLFSIGPMTLNDVATTSLRFQRSANNATDTFGGSTMAFGATMLYNGTNFERQRDVAAATGTTGTGVLAAGNMLWDLVGVTNFVKQAGDGSGRAMVVGAAAAGAAVAGNPLLVGMWDGTNVQYLKSDDTTHNNLQVALRAGSNAATISGANDGFSGSGIGLLTNSYTYLYNGATLDRARANVDVTLLASASRTTTQTSADIVTYNCQAIFITVDVTVIGTGSITMTVNYKDPASGKYILLLSGAAIVGNSTNLYKVDPRGPTAVANVSAFTAIGRTIQIVITANNANAVTYSVGYTLIPG